MVIITKEIKGNDGKMRKMFFDTENKIVGYSGFASDFRRIASKDLDLSAQQVLDIVEKELQGGIA